MKWIYLVLFSLFFLGCELKQPYQAPKATDVVASPSLGKIVAQPTPVETKPISAPTKVAAFSQAKTMRFPTINGKIITIQADENLLRITNPEYQGKEVMLYLFGSNCPHCKHEVAQIRRLSHKSNIKIIGVHAYKMIGNRALKSYARKVGYGFDILSFANDVELLKYLDKSGLWAGGTPTHLLIDPSGNVKDMRITDLLAR